MGADCKSVAKATKVRILHPPHGAETASDLRQRGRGPFSLSPAGSGVRQRDPSVCGRTVGRTIMALRRAASSQRQACSSVGVSFDQTSSRTSRSAFHLAEHRVLFGVVHELADILRTPAGDRELRGPLQRRLPGGYVDDRHAADELLALRVRAVGDHPVGGHHGVFHVAVVVSQPAGEDEHAGIHGLLAYRVGGLAHGGPVLVGDVVHRALLERDQVLRHLIAPCLGGRPPTASSPLLRTARSVSDTLPENRKVGGSTPPLATPDDLPSVQVITHCCRADAVRGSPARCGNRRVGVVVVDRLARLAERQGGAGRA